MHKQVTKHPQNLALLTYYNTYKNKLKHLLKTAKTNYYKNKIKETWNIIKEVTGQTCTKPQDKYEITINNKLETSPKKEGSFFNQFFTEIGSKLADVSLNKLKLTEEEITERFFNHQSNANSMFLTPTNSDEIYKIIKKLKATNSSGEDGIKANLLKFVSQELSDVITFLINLSFANGEFPDSLKGSIVRPIFKKNDKTDVNCFRPISIQNTLSKVFEDCMRIRLVKFL